MLVMKNGIFFALASVSHELIKEIEIYSLSQSIYELLNAEVFPRPSPNMVSTLTNVSMVFLSIYILERWIDSGWNYNDPKTM